MSPFDTLNLATPEDGWSTFVCPEVPESFNVPTNVPELIPVSLSITGTLLDVLAKLEFVILDIRLAKISLAVLPFTIEELLAEVFDFPGTPKPFSFTLPKVDHDEGKYVVCLVSVSIFKSLSTTVTSISLFNPTVPVGNTDKLPVLV